MSKCLGQDVDLTLLLVLACHSPLLSVTGDGWSVGSKLSACPVPAFLPFKENLHLVFVVVTPSLVGGGLNLRPDSC